MALSAEKKLEMKRGWVVVSDDASCRSGEIIGWYKTGEAAWKAAGLFQFARRETVDEVKARLASRSA